MFVFHSAHIFYWQLGGGSTIPLSVPEPIGKGRSQSMSEYHRSNSLSSSRNGMGALGSSFTGSNGLGALASSFTGSSEVRASMVIIRLFFLLVLKGFSIKL